MKKLLVFLVFGSTAIIAVSSLAGTMASMQGVANKTIEQRITYNSGSPAYDQWGGSKRATQFNPFDFCNATYASWLKDVGTDSITSPPDTVTPEAAYVPVGWVHNYGDSSEYFLVICQIDSFGGVVYTDTQQVINLAPGADQEVGFMQWTVPPEQGVTYRTCVWTILIGDTDPSNDTLCTLSYVITGVAEELHVRRPARASLYQNVPNPFSSTTSISYEIPVSGRVNISIYDVSGSSVRTLQSGTVEPGIHTVTWDGKDDLGRDVGGGVYFYKLSMRKLESTAKLVLVK